MIGRLLSSPWALVAAWVLGPLALWYIARRKKAKAEAEAKRHGSATQATGAHKTVKSSGGFPAPSAEPGLDRRDVVIPGFRDMRWGAAPTEDMNVYHSAGEETLYMRPKDVLMLEGHPLTSILYSFWGRRLKAVMIDMPIFSAEPVLKGLTALWGPPKQPNAHAPKYYWLDLLAGRDATQAVLEKNAMLGKASLIISRKPPKEEPGRSS